MQFQLSLAIATVPGGSTGGVVSQVLGSGPWCPMGLLRRPNRKKGIPADTDCAHSSSLRSSLESHLSYLHIHHQIIICQASRLDLTRSDRYSKSVLLTKRQLVPRAVLSCLYKVQPTKMLRRQQSVSNGIGDSGIGAIRNDLSVTPYRCHFSIQPRHFFSRPVVHGLGA
jgi:hypothetical protein